MNICARGTRRCTCQDRHAEGMLALTCWRVKYGKIVRIIFTSWFGPCCIYVCCFLRFDASTKKLFVSFITMFCFLVFLSGCCVISGKYCKHSAFMIIFRYIEIKYSWKLIISLLKYCILHKTQSALQYIDNHIFLSWLILPGILVYFSDLLAVKKFNSIS